MSYILIIHTRNISTKTPSDREKTRRHIIRKFRRAYSRTGFIFNRLNFEDVTLIEDPQGQTVALSIRVNQQNSLVVTGSSDSEEVLDTKVYKWNDFADAIINLF